MTHYFARILSQFCIFPVRVKDVGEDLDGNYHRGLSPASQTTPNQVQITRPEYSHME